MASHCPRCVCYTLVQMDCTELDTNMHPIPNHRVGYYPKIPVRTVHAVSIAQHQTLPPFSQGSL